MKNTKLKAILTFLGISFATIVLEHIFSDPVQYILDFLSDVGNKFVSAFVDYRYYSMIHAYLDQHWSFTHTIQTALYSLLLSLFIVTHPFFRKHFQNSPATDSKTLHNSRRLLYVFDAFLLVIYIVFMLVHIADGVYHEMAISMSANIEIVSPYISDNDYKILRSDFLSIRSKEDYKLLNNLLHSIAEDESLRLL